MWIIFYHWLMGSWKTEKLLKVRKSLLNKDKDIVILTAGIDDRTKIGEISSRNWDKIQAHNIYYWDTVFRELLYNIDTKNSILLIDEAQFLTSDQLHELNSLWFNKIICFWLLTDFQDNFFEGSEELIKIAYKSIKLCSYFTQKCIICKIEKAHINWRFINNQLVTKWDQIWIEWKNIEYKVVCKSCFTKNNK
jgi:thymidine kinase